MVRSRIVLAGVCALLSSLTVPALAQWTTDPLVNKPVAVLPESQLNPFSSSDGAGGAFVVWEHFGDVLRGVSFVQRIGANGELQWPDNVPVVTPGIPYHVGQCVADGMGGAIVITEDYRLGVGPDGLGQDIYAQRIGPDGTRLWGPDGVPVCTGPEMDMNFRAAPDGKGGAFVVWETLMPSTVRAQRLDAQGHTLWPAEGVLVASNGRGPDVVTSGDGIILGWKAIGSGYWVQRLGPDGVPTWDPAGIEISETSVASQQPALITDGEGGAIILAGANERSDGWIRAIKIRSDGTLAWGCQGVGVAPAGQSSFATLVSDGHGGAITAWIEAQTPEEWALEALVKSQRVDANGTLLWGESGVIAGTGSFGITPPAISDDDGGAIVLWPHGSDDAMFLYAQRLDSSGAPQWTLKGAPLCLVASHKQTWQAVSDGAGGVIGVWVDGRNRNENSTWDDIYADHIDHAGPAPASTSADSIHAGSSLPASVELRALQPNPARDAVVLAFGLPRPGHVRLRMFDVSGRAVRTLRDGQAPQGFETIRFDLRDDNGRRLASGLYVVRLETDDGVRTRRLALVR
jgi:hypothetical protein